MYFDSAFEVRAYVWVGAWYAIFCFDQLYIKYAALLPSRRPPPAARLPRRGPPCRAQVCRGRDGRRLELGVRTPVPPAQPASRAAQLGGPRRARRVFYTNLWACGIATVICAATEPQTLLTLRWTRESMAALAVSAALGVGMSYFAFICRASVSATCFTILGNVCKARRPLPPTSATPSSRLARAPLPRAIAAASHRSAALSSARAAARRALFALLGVRACSRQWWCDAGLPTGTRRRGEGPLLSLSALAHRPPPRRC